MDTYKKLNNEEIKIVYVPDEHDEGKDFLPSFWFFNRRYYLDDFTRVHNNPWIYDDFPEYIHAIQADDSAESYTNPLYIELISDEMVNVYKEVLQNA